MNWIINPSTLHIFNLVLLGGLIAYLATKVARHRNVIFIQISLMPLLALEVGAYLFEQSHSSFAGALLIILAIVLTPVTIVPLSHLMGRLRSGRRKPFWIAFYAIQIPLLVFVLSEIAAGRVVEWVTGILEQPIIIIEKGWRYYFLNILGSNILALLCFDRTLQNAGESEKEKLKFVFIAFLGFTVYFSFLSANIFLSSYVSQSTLSTGTAVVLGGLAFLSYSFFKYPLWEVSIRVSRRLVFGVFSAIAALLYLVVSGTILEILRFAEPQALSLLLPVLAFAFVAFLLVFYLSPSCRGALRGFLTRHFFRNKYDYRDLWMKFSDRSSGSLSIREVLPRVAEFVAEAMFVQQVAIWLRSSTTDSFSLAYCHDAGLTGVEGAPPLKLGGAYTANRKQILYQVPDTTKVNAESDFPTDNLAYLRELGIARIVLVEKNSEVLALLGIGRDVSKANSSAEDEPLLTSISNHLGNLILTHKLSDELLLSREWESFNRFASFILHDLKNLATLQSMTLENARHLSHNPNFLADAFQTFQQTTEKMISLIASLSVQRGQFSLKQQPVNILKVISSTFEDLKISQRNGVNVRTAFPPADRAPIISGDPELLQKAFTNLLLNAIQSLPKGRGDVEVSVSQKNNGKMTAAIRDTGCGIPADRLGSLFRPFQTTKEKGMGIGLCHTRSIIEVHGGQIRIESQVNLGTKVEVDLPTL
jgi:putative PEP-CTERM system histidine kinase